MPEGPLSGIRILDTTQIIAGPLGCMLLADLGAEVVKVEPVAGEAWRHTGTFMPVESKGYQSLNRGKDSVALNLQDPAGREIILRFAATSDVMVINYRPEVAKRIGIDYESIRKVRPDIVYVDSTGFGRRGPWAHRPGYDIVAQAASGLMMVRDHLDDNGRPGLHGPGAPADVTTGYAIAWAVCAALFHRQRTGEGQMVETSLLVNALMLQGSTFMSLPAVDAELRAQFHDDLAASRARGEHFLDFVHQRRARQQVVSGGGVYYRCYLTRDAAVAIGALSEATRSDFRRAIDVAELTDTPMPTPDSPAAKRFSDSIIAKVEARMAEKTTEEWMAIFDEHRVPASPVQYVEQLIDDPQVVENGYVVDLDHDLTGPQRMVASPLRMSATPAKAERAAPPLGRDTRKWLRTLGYGDEQIDELAAAGVVRLGPFE